MGRRKQTPHRGTRPDRLRPPFCCRGGQRAVHCGAAVLACDDGAARGRGAPSWAQQNVVMRGRIRGSNWPPRESRTSGGDGLRAVHADQAARADRDSPWPTTSWCAESPPPIPQTPGSPASSGRPIASLTDGCSPTRGASDSPTVTAGSSISLPCSPTVVAADAGNLNLDVPETLTVPITVPESSRCAPAS